MTTESRACCIRRAINEQLERYASIVGDDALSSVRITVNVGAGGLVRSVVVEPQLRVEAGR